MRNESICSPRAIKDIEYALNMIEYVTGSESDTNLYNTLAHACFDIADVKEKMGSPQEEITEYRAKANSAARSAYNASPTNRYVVEMFVRNLLTTARTVADSAIECSIEALGIVFAALVSNEESYRKTKLDELADRAIAIFKKNLPKNLADKEPSNEIEVLMKAWIEILQGIDRADTELYKIPESNCVRAINVLGHKAGRGNPQVVRLTYELVCIVSPWDFKRQIDFLSQLQDLDYRRAPQERLEYGVLLYQNNRAVEGDKVFRSLRRFWRETDHFVEVPERLQWLRDSSSGSLKVVRAFVTMSDVGRPLAKVKEFQNCTAPFRPVEFGQKKMSIHARFNCNVVFGHNGPFLRPVTVKST